MPMPALLTVSGTGTSAIWTPDWMQAPFSIAYFLAPNSTATTILQVSYDNLDGAATNTLGGPATVTAGSMTWVTVAGPLASATTGVISAPVRAIQLNLVTSSGTGVCTATFIQATFPR
jgi:hypothetical protein